MVEVSRWEKQAQVRMHLQTGSGSYVPANININDIVLLCYAAKCSIARFNKLRTGE
jgi:hypothetical protein